MADADALWRAGDLAGARAELVSRVRARPADQPTRMFLFQLLAVAGEWSKAQAQLDTLAKLSPEAAMLALAYGGAIAAEEARAEAFAGRAPVPVLAGAGGWADGLARAIELGAQGHAADAEQVAAAALKAAPDTPGTLNGVAIDWIADADPRFGPALEAIVGGRWGILPFSAVERIESAGVRDLRDTVWFPAEVTLRQGARVAAMLPARYPGTERAASTRMRLGHATDWDADGHGIGQRVLVSSDGEERGLLSLRDLRFAA